MEEWWEDNKIHYTVRDPETLCKWHGMVDTFLVADAAIYSADNIPKIGLYFLVTKQQLMVSGKEAIVGKSKGAMLEKVKEWQAKVEEQEGSIQVLHWWTGEEFKRRPATV